MFQSRLNMIAECARLQYLAKIFTPFPFSYYKFSQRKDNKFTSLLSESKNNLFKIEGFIDKALDLIKKRQ